MKSLFSSMAFLASAALMFSVAMRAVMGVLARLLSMDMAVMEQVALRCLFGALILGCVGWRRIDRQGLRRAPVRDVWLLVLRGSAMFVVGMSLGTVAFIEGNYITTTLVLASPTTVLVSWLCFGESLSWRVMWLVLLSFVGVLCIVPSRGESILLGLPLWCALGAALCMSWGMMAARWQTAHFNAAESAFWMLLISALLAGIVALTLALSSGVRPKIEVGTLLIAAAAGLAGIGFLWMSDYAVPRLKGVVVNNILATQPLFGALIGFGLYGEVLSGLQWFGALLILGSVYRMANLAAD